MKIRIGDFEHWPDAIHGPSGCGTTGAAPDYKQAVLTNVEPVQGTCHINFQAEHQGRVYKFSFPIHKVEKKLAAVLSENIGKKKLTDLADLTIVL